MKRKIALLLAVVMILSLVPMMSFAASNTKTIVVTTPSVADDYDSEVTGGFQRISTLVIEGDAFKVENNSAFQLKLESGVKWSDAYSVSAVAQKVYDDAGLGTGAFGAYEIVKRTDRVLDIKLTADLDSGDRLYIPLYVKVDGATGPLKVTVDSVDSGIAGGTYTFANVGKGATVATIEDVISFSEIGELDVIRIEETAVNAIGAKSQKIKLRLPNNFTWASVGTVEGIGGFAGISASSLVVNGGTAGSRDLEITINTAGRTTQRGAILLKDAEIKASSSAREGEVSVTISGDEVSTQDLVVAKHADYAIVVKADGEPRDLISGRFVADARDSEDAADLRDDANKLQTLIIKEEIAGSLLNRRTRVEFPSWVKIVGADVKKADNATVDADGLRASIGKYDVAEDTVIFKDGKRGDNYIEFTVAGDGVKKAEIKLQFYVSVKADAEGDIVAKVTGRSGADGEVVLGTARRVVEVEASAATELVIGRKAQPIADITISEIEKEDLMAGNLVLALPSDLDWNSTPTIEVVEGDLEIKLDNVSRSANLLTIPVTNADRSTKPSTIKVTNAKVDVNRTVAEGNVNVGIRGTAVRLNHVKDHANNVLDNGYFDQSNVVSVKVATVITPAVGGARPEVKMTIGVVPEGGDAAPYIKNARTYAPVSAVAQALGIQKSNVIWNAEDRTVTILGDKTVQMTIGSKTLLVNGVAVQMDVAAEITNSRTFLPIAWLAKALDVEYSWDAATQTVTFY